MSEVHWRLVYGDGAVVDEPDGDASIRLAPRGARWLQLTKPGEGGERVAWTQVPLFGERTEGLVVGAGGVFGGEDVYQPIFYRKRGVTAFGNGEHRGMVKTFGIVLGRGKEVDDRVDCNLWLWRPGMREPGACPEEAIDRGMIELQVLRPEPGPIEVA